MARTRRYASGQADAPKGAADDPPALPRIGPDALTSRAIADIVQARAVAAGLGRRDLGGHSLKRGALTTGMERGIHPAKLKRLGRHKSFDVLGEYLEFGDLFDGHPLSGVLAAPPRPRRIMSQGDRTTSHRAASPSPALPYRVNRAALCPVAKSERPPSRSRLADPASTVWSRTSSLLVPRPATQEAGSW